MQVYFNKTRSPFNLEYISTTFILETIKNRVKIINDPSSIRNISKNFIPLNTKNLVPSTILTKISMEQKFFRENKNVILKPIHSFGGDDIYFTLIKFRLNFIKKYIKKTVT